MAYCVGYLVSGGNTFVVVDTTIGVVTPSATACPSDAWGLVLNRTEYAEVASNPWLQLTAAEGASLSVAILALWAVAYGFRALKRTLDVDSSGHLN